MKTFHLTIARVGENLFSGEAHLATLPGIEGVFTVMAGHEAFVSQLKEGEVRFETAEGEKRNITIAHGGVAEVSANQATIIL